MVNYNNGKVYMIQPIMEHEEGEIYIGSTTKQYLSQRMDNHRRRYKFWKNGKGTKFMCFDLFDKYGIENCQILLIENVHANSKDELVSREGYYIRNMKCINKNIAGRTKTEYNKEYIKDNKDKAKLYHSEYRKNNKEIIKEKQHQYYVDNQAIISEKHHKYYVDNKEKIKEYKRKYYLNNKEKIIEKGNKKTFCQCGIHYTDYNKSKHFKTFKHQSRMKLFERVNQIINNFHHQHYHLHYI
jgi:hypothetical protein